MYQIPRYPSLQDTDAARSSHGPHGGNFSDRKLNPRLVPPFIYDHGIVTAPNRFHRQCAGIKSGPCLVSSSCLFINYDFFRTAIFLHDAHRNGSIIEGTSLQSISPEEFHNSHCAIPRAPNSARPSAHANLINPLIAHTDLLVNLSHITRLSARFISLNVRSVLIQDIIPRFFFNKRGQEVVDFGKGKSPAYAHVYHNLTPPYTSATEQGSKRVDDKLSLLSS